MKIPIRILSLIVLIVLLSGCENGVQEIVATDDEIINNTTSQEKEVGESVIEDFILQHLIDESDSVSLYVAKDGEKLVEYNANVVRPLASTVKIIIAIEYAMQVDEGKIKADALIPISDLEKYYLSGTDGGAHERWLKSVNNKIENNEVTLHEIAKGMIEYSSNANTDYLTNLLGVSNINDRIAKLGLVQHEDVYSIVGAQFIPSYIKQSKNIESDELLQELLAMPMESYRSLSNEISNMLKNEELKKENLILPTLERERNWSDRLIGSTAEEYGRLLASISRDEFSPKVNEILRDLLEWPMKNLVGYNHFGAKGGSTIFVYNQAVYAEDYKGQKFEIVIFMDNLNMEKNQMLQKELDPFLFKLIKNEDYRESVKTTLSNIVN